MSLKIRLLLFYLNYIAPKNPYSQLSPQEVREMNAEELNKLGHIIDDDAIDMHRVYDREIPVRDGASIPIRIYKPSQSRNLPMIVFYHGGGFVSRSIDSHDKVCRRIAKLNEAMLVSVGYRLAPEFKFPTPVYDCYDATSWVAEQAHQLGGDASRLVVMGDSAGGNLATVISILSRKLNGPKIKYQVLIYPTTDARLNHPSIKKYGKGYLLTKDMIDWFVNHYKRTEEDRLDPMMSPLLETDLSNLPPSFISTAQYDPLKDEGAAYAQRLLEAGNEVIYKEYPGVIHGFINMPKMTKQTLYLHEDIKQTLEEVFAEKSLIS